MPSKPSTTGFYNNCIKRDGVLYAPEMEYNSIPRNRLMAALTLGFMETLTSQPFHTQAGLSPLVSFCGKYQMNRRFQMGTFPQLPGSIKYGRTVALATQFIVRGEDPSEHEDWRVVQEIGSVQIERAKRAVCSAHGRTVYEVASTDSDAPIEYGYEFDVSRSTADKAIEYDGVTMYPVSEWDVYSRKMRIQALGSTYTVESKDDLSDANADIQRNWFNTCKSVSLDELGRDVFERRCKAAEACTKAAALVETDEAEIDTIMQAFVKATGAKHEDNPSWRPGFHRYSLPTEAGRMLCTVGGYRSPSPWGEFKGQSTVEFGFSFAIGQGTGGEQIPLSALASHVAAATTMLQSLGCPENEEAA